MDAYCLVLLANIQQILQHAADREIEKEKVAERERSRLEKPETAL